MAGHSKWANIKRKKAVEDKKRAAVFNKITKAIMVAARSGSDPETNHELRGLIEKAKNLNVPKNKIENAIKKGSGELKSDEKLEGLLLEAYGPAGIAMLIEAVTDNRNRTTAEVKDILKKNGGKPTQEGGVRWMFEKTGVLYVDREKIENNDAFELLSIDLGVENIAWNSENAELHTKPENIRNALRGLNDAGYNDIRFGLEWVPKNKQSVDENTQKQLERLFEALDDNEDVQEIYTNT